MSEGYTPPFVMTEEITNLVIEIGEQVGAVAAFDRLQPNPRLRRENRIKSIYSSLAIEQNTLTLGQVTDVIESGNKAQHVGINVGTNEEKILALLRQDSRLTAKMLASTIGLTDRQVERILAKLKAAGKIVRHGASKNGYWEVCCT